MWWFTGAPQPTPTVDPILSKMKKACFSVKADYDLMEWVGLTDDAVILACAEKAAEVAKEIAGCQICSAHILHRTEDCPFRDRVKDGVNYAG